jgi:hypothetical protein
MKKGDDYVSYTIMEAVLFKSRNNIQKRRGKDAKKR